MKESRCTYCPRIGETTQDHVPPRSIYPSKLPNDTQLVTVPSCYVCHKANQKDDATIRNFLISFKDTENHPSVLAELAEKRDRSLKRSLERSGADFYTLAETMKLVEVQTKEGLHIGEQVAFDLDNPTMNRFMERLARALLSHAFNQEYFDGTFEWRFEQKIPHYIYEGMMQFGSVRRVSSEFTYGLTKATDEHPSWIVANFYGNTEFLICAKKKT